MIQLRTKFGDLEPRGQDAKNASFSCHRMRIFVLMIINKTSPSAHFVKSKTDNIITFIYFRVDQYFRIYFEQKIRSKTGSHIGPKIKLNRKPCDYEGLKSQFTEKGLSAYP